MAAYNGVNGVHDDREPAAARRAQGRVGLRRRRDVRLVRGPLDRGRRQRRRSTSPCRGRPGRGATRWSQAVRDGRVSEAAVDDKVLRLLRLAARVGALEGVDAAAPPARPWSDERGGRRAARRRGGRLRAGAQRGRAAAARRARTLRRVAVDRAQRRRRRGRSAAAARRSSRPTRSRRSTGLRAALGRRRGAARARRARRTPASPPATAELLRRGRGALPRRRRRGAGLRASAARHVHVAGLLRRGRAGERGRGGRGPRAPARRRRPASTWSAPRASGASQLDARRRGRVRRRRSSCRPAPTSSRASCARPSTASRSRSRRARRSTLVLRHEPPSGGADALRGVTTFQLNVEPPHASDDEELERAVAAAASADVAVVVVGTTEEVESEGFDRDVARAARPPGRARRAASRRRTRAPSSSSTPARRCCCRGPMTCPPCCSTWFPGQEFGHALADVLLGAAEPGGRLPTTWPASTDGLPSDAAGRRDARLRRGHLRRLPRLRPRRARAAVPVRPRPGLHQLGVPRARVATPRACR